MKSSILALFALTFWGCLSQAVDLTETNTVDLPVEVLSEQGEIVKSLKQFRATVHVPREAFATQITATTSQKEPVLVHRVTGADGRPWYDVMDRKGSLVAGQPPLYVGTTKINGGLASVILAPPNGLGALPAGDYVVVVESASPPRIVASTKTARPGFAVEGILGDPAVVGTLRISVRIAATREAETEIRQDLTSTGLAQIAVPYREARIRTEFEVLPSIFIELDEMKKQFSFFRYQQRLASNPHPAGTLNLWLFQANFTNLEGWSTHLPGPIVTDTSDAAVFALAKETIFYDGGGTGPSHPGDYATVAAHEMGHFLGNEHVCEFMQNDVTDKYDDTDCGTPNIMATGNFVQPGAGFSRRQSIWMLRNPGILLSK